MMGYLETAGVIAVPMLFGSCVLLLLCAISWCVDVYEGDAEMPNWMRIKKKTPRKAATKRGIVGQRVRRSTCICSTIVPQPTLDVKCDLPLRVEWHWMRG